LISLIRAEHNAEVLANLHFKGINRHHSFIYFQNHVTLSGKKTGSDACILYTEGSPYDYVSPENFINSYINFKAPSEIFALSAVKTNKVLYPTNCGEINDILHRICREDAMRETGYEASISALVLSLLVAASRGSAPPQRSNSDFERAMADIRGEYLRDLQNPPKIEDLMRKYGVSRTRFYKTYMRLFHNSPKNDLLLRRMEHFRSIVTADPEVKIYEAAFLCGFNDMPGFFHLFKRRFGYTPKEYAEAVKSARVSNE